MNNVPCDLKPMYCNRKRFECLCKMALVFVRKFIVAFGHVH